MEMQKSETSRSGRTRGLFTRLQIQSRALLGRIFFAFEREFASSAVEDIKKVASILGAEFLGLVRLDLVNGRADVFRWVIRRDDLSYSSRRNGFFAAII